MKKKKKLNKKINKKELVLWPIIYQNYFLSKIVLSKIMKHFRLNYVLVMYILWQKNKFRLQNKLSRKILTWGWQITAVLRNLWLALPRLPRLLYQIIVSITLYIVVF